EMEAELEVEAELEAEEPPSPWGEGRGEGDRISLAEPEAASPSFGAILEEGEFSFDLEEDDELARAMAEAAAAVGGSPAPAVAEPESDEIELDLEDVFEVDLPDLEEEEPSSLVRPPADMLGAPARPAWSQEATPAPGTAFAPAAPAGEPEPVEEIELELDDPFASLEAAGWTTEPPSWLAEESAEPEAAAPAPLYLEIEEEPAPAAPEREEDLDLVTEAEVLAKYGLEDKAVERLGEALRLQPDHLQAYTLLIQIHLDKGRHGLVVELANRMSEAAARRAKGEIWQKVRKKLADAGYRLDGERVAGPPQAARPAGRPAEKMDDLLKSILGPAPKTPRAPARPPAVSTPPSEPAPPSPEAVLPEPVPPESMWVEPAHTDPFASMEAAGWTTEPPPF